MFAFFEAEVPEGLEELAWRDIVGQLAHTKHLRQSKGELRFLTDDAWSRLRQLRSVIAISYALWFDVPRPKALLGHQQMTRIEQSVAAVLKQYSSNTFQTLYLDAAGKDSTVMRRIEQAIAQKFGLKTSEKGDLRLRIRPSRLYDSGWDVLIRLSPRPSATRAWRTHNMQGALSAPVAYLMGMLASANAHDALLNLGCGSGTLLIEGCQQATYCVGLDNNSQLLRTITEQHLSHAGLKAHLVCADMRHLPFGEKTFDVLLADLPFGQLVGNQKDNQTLYPAILAEAGRVAVPNARFVLITHAVNLFETVLKDFSTTWTCAQTHKITLNGLHPRIYTLIRQS